jgi:hypothetical protein
MLKELNQTTIEHDNSLGRDRLNYEWYTDTRNSRLKFRAIKVGKYGQKAYCIDDKVYEYSVSDCLYTRFKSHGLIFKSEFEGDPVAPDEHSETQISPNAVDGFYDPVNARHLIGRRIQTRYQDVLHYAYDQQWAHLR